MLTVYHPVTIRKLVIMTVCTLGFYVFFIWYKNFEYIRKREQNNKSSFWRSFFMIFTVYKLYSDVNRTSKKKLAKPMPHCFFWANLFIICLLAAFCGSLFLNMSSIYQVVLLLCCSFIFLLPLIPLQRTINALNIADGMKRYIDHRYTLKSILAILLGLLVWYLTITASLMLKQLPSSTTLQQQLTTTTIISLPKEH